MSNKTHTPDNLPIPRGKYSQFTETKTDIISDWKTDFTKRIQNESKSRKDKFTFSDACGKENLHTERDKVFLSVISFLNSDPLQNNDYLKYVSCYVKTGQKLDEKYFKNNLNKLNEYYNKADEKKAKGDNFNPFCLIAYQTYVLYSSLKFSGHYTSDLDEVFDVQTLNGIENNPLKNIPSVLRGELPFEFSNNEFTTPTIENEIIKFYSIDQNNKVVTSPTMYADFFIQENFLRISTPDDKIFLLRDTNNVVDFFNHNTDTVMFLKSNIVEFGSSFDAVADIIAKENFTTIKQGFLLIPSNELKYYSDTKKTFGLPFKNGFYYFDIEDNGALKNKKYTDVKGFFAPHEMQTREFKYTDEVGMFENFLMRVSIGQKEPNNQDTNNIVESFSTMFGYLCHNYKDATKNPCIVLTDMDADDETRNGRRGKTLLFRAVQEVQESIIKGGKEFDSGYTFVFADLEKKHNVYIIDDVPAGFKYDDLYTNVLGDINCQRKGAKAEPIKFKDAPKFAITSNWVVPYDEKNASTNGRFIEYKFTNYYNTTHTPKDEFNCTFFQDWDADEWNRFYSFVFRCVKLFLQKGIIKTDYNKAGDNYKAYFSNDVIYTEFERIISIVIQQDNFNVSEFLSIYNDSGNNLRFEKMFTQKNTKKFIDAWAGKFNIENESFYFEYTTSKRKWVKKSK